MAFDLKIKNGTITRHDRIDHAIGDRERALIRDAATAKRDGNSPWNEAVTLTYDEYELLKRIKPQLFDKTIDPLTRKQHWLTFLNSSEGKHFRTR